jgi:hypothetical protein
LLKEGTLKKVALAVLLLAGAATVFWEARWYVFQVSINNVLEALPKTPPTARLTGLRRQIRESATKLWIPPDSIELDVHLEQHGSNGFAAKEDMTEYYWFVVVHAKRSANRADWERRIDNKLDEPDLAALEADGLPVKRRPRS